ncbi:hypothetical protein [Streptomyces aureus]|uniref:hypothetical protein n=1 Tax=Streptomyces aureus TaxID=193461 RepID=UPI0036AE68CE
METDCSTPHTTAPARPGPLPAGTRLLHIGPHKTGTRLLHIGPHKTGTTSIQGALFAAKDAMAAPGSAARALYGALAAVVAQSARTAGIRSVHQTPSGELVRVLGHRVLRRLRRT